VCSRITVLNTDGWITSSQPFLQPQVVRCHRSASIETELELATWRATMYTIRTKIRSSSTRIRCTISISILKIRLLRCSLSFRTIIRRPERPRSTNISKANFYSKFHPQGRSYSYRPHAVPCASPKLAAGTSRVLQLSQPARLPQQGRRRSSRVRRSPLRRRSVHGSLPSNNASIDISVTQTRRHAFAKHRAQEQVVGRHRLLDPVLEYQTYASQSL
jgi:hypothetical protein